MARREELLNQCAELGVVPEKSRRRKDTSTGLYYYESTINDCEKAVQSYYIKKYEEDGTLNPFLADILHLDSPMLALQSKDKKLDKIRDSLWEDDNEWVFQEKIDGCRCMLCYNKNYGWDFFSRNKSISDCLPISYGEKILIPKIDEALLEQYKIESFIIDTELIPVYKTINPMSDGTELVAETQQNLVTSILGSLPDLSHRMQETNPLKFMAFDIVKLNNNWVTDLPLKDRMKFLGGIYTILSKSGLNERISLLPNISTNKKVFYEQIIHEGGEGCVVKDINSKYDLLGKRAGEWIKVKRTVSQSLLVEKLGDTVDAFITGFKLGNPGTNRENQVSAFEFSVYLTDDNNDYLLDENGNPIVHHIATMSGLTDELRAMATYIDPQTLQVSLNPRMYGAVAEIDGQDISSKNLRFAHAVFKGWRTDRSADTCKMRKSTLESLVL